MFVGLIQAAAETGIEMTLLLGLDMRAGFDGAPLEPAQRRFAMDEDRMMRLLGSLRRHARGMGGLRIGLAPHAVRGGVGRAMTAALPDETPIHIHVAEQLREVEDCLAQTGARPVELLMVEAPVGPSWCLIHATHVEQSEIEDIAASGAVVGLCPITEANLGDGLFPLGPFLAAEGRFGL